MHKVYKQYSRYYDLIFSDKDYHAESAFIERVIRKQNPKAESVLDIGCGTGTHLLYLEEQFDRTCGIDFSCEMLAIAKAKCPKTRFTQADMLSFKIEERFDAIIAMFAVVNYCSDIEKLHKFIANAKAHLDDQGVLILATYNPRTTKGVNTTDQIKLKGISIAKKSEILYDPKTKVEVTNFYFDIIDHDESIHIKDEHKFKIYSNSEFEKALYASGFTNINFFDEFTEKPANKNSKHTLIVASAS